MKRLRVLRLAALKDSPNTFGSKFQEVATYSENTWRSQFQTLPTLIAVFDSVDGGTVRVSYPNENTAGEAEPYHSRHAEIDK